MDSCSAESQKMDKQEEDECFSYAFQLMSAATLPNVLNAVVRLDVLEIIAKAGPGAQLSPSEIASHMPTENPGAPAVLDRMLGLLANYSVLTCSVVDGGAGAQYQRRYGLAPVAKYFVKEQYGAPLRPFLIHLIHNKVLAESWYELEGAVLEGGTAFERTHSCNMFTYIAKDPNFNKAFNNAMSSLTNAVLVKFIKCYKGFENVKTLVDVGGAFGHALIMITSKYPNIRGINFDLPHIVGLATSHPGIEHKGGDMFQSVPEADAIFVKSILHNWDDEHCLKLLRNCYKALPKDGKIIAIEAILPLNPESGDDAVVRSNFQTDIAMMVTCSPGGKERSEIEFQALATEAGFSGIRVESRVFIFSVLEFYK